MAVSKNTRNARNDPVFKEIHNFLEKHGKKRGSTRKGFGDDPKKMLADIERMSGRISGRIVKEEPETPKNAHEVPKNAQEVPKNTQQAKGKKEIKGVELNRDRILRSLLVTNIAADAEEDDIYDAFERFLPFEVTIVDICHPINGTRAAIIEFEDIADAIDAAELISVRIFGMKVEIHRPVNYID